MDMEKRNCPLCNGRAGRIAYRTGGLTILKCSSCECMYMDLVPGASALSKIYDDKYKYPAEDMEKTVRGFEEGTRPFLDDRLRSIKRHKASGKLLDIGCNYGIFLTLARKAGYDVRGVDISKPAATYAKERSGLEVLNTTVKEARFPAGSFDIITMFDVLEHLTDPLEDLIEVRRVLKKDGLFFMTTPNTAVYLIKAKIVAILPFLKYYKNNYPGTPFEANELALPYHINHFTPRTLRKMLLEAGFRDNVEFDFCSFKKYQGRFIRDRLRKAYGLMARIAFRSMGIYMAPEISVCAGNGEPGDKE